MVPYRVDGEGGTVEYPPEDPNSPQAGRNSVVYAAANVDDVMREQLEDLCEHKAACRVVRDCRDCQRWADVQKILMEPFAEPERTAKAGA